jgi:hypothetical protein
MANFKVVWEIEIEALTPLEAAKKSQEWMREPETNWQFYVQKDGNKIVYSVDLDEEEEDAVLPITEYHPMIKELYE